MNAGQMWDKVSLPMVVRTVRLHYSMIALT